MNITLYKAAEELREILSRLDAETGELPDGYESARALVANKSTAVAAFIAQTEYEISVVETHAKMLSERVKSEKKKMERLRDYLAFHMKASGIGSIKTNDGLQVRLHIDRDESVDVYEPGLLDAVYVRETVKTEPDKVLIKRALKDGFEVQGARLVKSDRLEIK